MTGSADDGREDGTRSVISGETSLAHTRAVVYDQSCYIIVTHFAGLIFEPAKTTDIIIINMVLRYCSLSANIIVLYVNHVNRTKAISKFGADEI